MLSLLVQVFGEKIIFGLNCTLVRCDITSNLYEISFPQNFVRNDISTTQFHISRRLIFIKQIEPAIIKNTVCSLSPYHRQKLLTA